LSAKGSELCHTECFEESGAVSRNNGYYSDTAGLFLFLNSVNKTGIVPDKVFFSKNWSSPIKFFDVTGKSDKYDIFSSKLPNSIAEDHYRHNWRSNITIILLFDLL